MLGWRKWRKWRRPHENPRANGQLEGYLSVAQTALLRGAHEVALSAHIRVFANSARSGNLPSLLLRDIRDETRDEREVVPRLSDRIATFYYSHLTRNAI